MFYGIFWTYRHDSAGNPHGPESHDPVVSHEWHKQVEYPGQYDPQAHGELAAEALGKVSRRELEYHIAIVEWGQQETLVSWTPVETTPLMI